MSIESYIENLRGKPAHIRKRYAFWTSFGITMVIFAFWLSSFSVFSNKTQEVVATALNKTGTPAQSLIAGVGSFFTDIKDIAFGPKKIKYSSVEVTPGKK
ncbi:MAG: hypothetical protein Q7K45_00130 [Nanoarchaeota archaeon]|nr:hypothetical protein [Nanoarchaeota archaeon]